MAPDSICHGETHIHTPRPQDCMTLSLSYLLGVHAMPPPVGQGNPQLPLTNGRLSSHSYNEMLLNVCKSKPFPIHRYNYTRLSVVFRYFNSCHICTEKAATAPVLSLVQIDCGTNVHPMHILKLNRGRGSYTYTRHHCFTSAWQQRRYTASAAPTTTCYCL